MIRWVVTRPQSALELIHLRLQSLELLYQLVSLRLINTHT